MQWIPGEVVARKVWAEGLFTLSVRCEVSPFEPGQFLQLGVERDGKHIHRPYSVASSHGESLDFYIVLVEEGELTPQLWAMQVGDRIDISQRAAGSFTLSHAPLHPDLWLIATGTGLAPYLAMLEEGSCWDRYERVFVVHGVRYAHELAYYDELLALETEKKDRFLYVPIVSREVVSHALSGRITKCLAEGSLESQTKTLLSAERSTVLLCGNPDMLTEMELELGKKGLHKHKAKVPGHIVVERYW